MRREKSNEEKCFALIGPITQAIRAQKLLAAAGLYVQIIKADTISAKYGCAYAIEYSCHMEERVRQILRKEEIHVKWVHKMV